MPSQYFKRFSRILFILFILRTVHFPNCNSDYLFSPSAICHASIDTFSHLMIIIKMTSGLSIHMKNILVITTIHQHGSHDELNLTKQKEAAWIVSCFIFVMFQLSDTLSIIFTYMGSVVPVLCVFVITLQTSMHESL